MGIEITLDAFGYYHVTVTPPEAARWESEGALAATEVMERLHDLGCHQTDVMDALNVANPAWRVEHDAEVRRLRDAALETILREPKPDDRPFAEDE